MSRTVSMLVGAALAAVFALQAAPARAQGTLVLYCTRAGGMVPRDGHRLRARDRHQGRDDAQELRRVLRAAQGRSVQSARRRVVGRHRRSASAGGRGRPDARIRIADEHGTAATGRSTQWQQSKKRTIGVYAGALGYGYNTERHEEEGRAPSRNAGPTCSIRSFKDEVQVADPNSSGTSYTMLATIVQLMGEDKGFDYPQEAAPEHQPVHQVGRGAGQGGEPRRDR